MDNSYSSTWFDTFLRTIDPAQTEREFEFLRKQLPLPTFGRVMDLCCGHGRHSRLLSECGYKVTGVDVDFPALQQAKLNAPAAQFVLADMRHVHSLGGGYDGIVCLWQSFGYFEEATNQAVLAQTASLLRPGGRLVLDVYHRGFFELNQGITTFARGGLRITESKRVDGNRLDVQLHYHDSGSTEHFNWRIYAPDELSELGSGLGLTSILQCTSFLPSMPASRNSPRMQLVFERGQIA